MKRALALAALMLFFVWTASAHAALITVDGSFETNDFVSGGYNGTSAWHTNGFARTSLGGADGTSYYAKAYSETLYAFVTLFQVVPVDWGTRPPDVTEISISLDRRANDTSPGFMLLSLYGSNTQPEMGKLPTDPPFDAFGDSLYGTSMTSVSSVTWEDLIVPSSTLGPQSAYAYYTFSVVAWNVDIDNVSVDIAAVPVPLPASLLLLAGGLAGLLGIRPRRQV